MPKKNMPEAEENIFLFVPQLIGYTRIACLFAAFYNIDDYQLFLTLYCVSFGLDVLDGPAARYFGQSTYFGAALDMLTDKFSTPALFATLSRLYPHLMNIFVVLMILDVASHYFHLYAALLRGFTSHKNTDKTQNWLVRLFYGSKPFFAWTCLGHEVFLVLFYLANFTGGQEYFAVDVPVPGGVDGAAGVALSIMFPHLVPIGSTVSLGVFHIFILLTFPSFISKSLVHVAQLMSACEGIASYDLNQRRKSKKN
eukprot:GFYU01003809.1.p1 GENE.GFYU01003809.1~~GFYU01003809.1.p1  ORF type:complete len:254 (+),score=55.25 GFYU01003809.1:78-839(+)